MVTSLEKKESELIAKWKWGVPPQEVTEKLDRWGKDREQLYPKLFKFIADKRNKIELDCQ